jgi:hypothetical protein
MSSSSAIAARLDALTPTAFENLVYDCVRAIGLTNLVWRTPGADGGRDIEGDLVATDVTGFELRQRWYVECKRYSSSIDWPTVWQKIAYADVQNADVLFLVTNSNPSPSCETEINGWNAARRRPLLRTWRGYELPRILRTHTSIARAHGLLDPTVGVAGDGLDLALVINKLAQSAYSAMVFGQAGLSAVEAASCLSELLSQRLTDLKGYGKFVPATRALKLPDFEWLSATGDTSACEDVGLRAVLAFIRHVSACDRMSISANGGEVSVMLAAPKHDLSIQRPSDLNTVLLWSASELEALSTNGGFLIRQRVGASQ